MADVLREVTFPSGARLEVVLGNLTEEKVDAIVNAANEGLEHGGGVAGAICRAGGPALQAESRRVAPVAPRACAVTGAGKLPCKHVIHAVGPVWAVHEDPESLLESAVRAVLDTADSMGLASLSMPGISSGIFGCPKPICARVLIGTVRSFLETKPNSTLRLVRLCNIDSPTAEAFRAELDRQAGG